VAAVAPRRSGAQRPAPTGPVCRAGGRSAAATHLAATAARPRLVLLLTAPRTAPTTSTADLSVNAEVMQPPLETSTVSATATTPPAPKAAHEIENPYELRWDLYVDLATPSLPSMRGGFTPPSSASRTHTIAQVGGAADGRVVGRGEVTRSAVSGKSLAQQSSHHPRERLDPVELPSGRRSI
jgi:hypothetical protein